MVELRVVNAPAVDTVVDETDVDDDAAVDEAAAVDDDDDDDDVACP